MKINWLKKITANAHHNAFTDLCVFKQSLFCCFRQASNHVSGDGLIRIMKLDMQGKTLANNTIRIASCDLRDPKLSVTPDGTLLLLAHARHLNTGNKQVSRNLTWVSQDGLSWSSPKKVAQDFWWLWRVRWHNATAYGFAYNRDANAVDLYQGDPRRAFHKIAAGALSLHQHQLGYPNESDLVFTQKACFALIRRDADTYTAQLGHSQFPFKHWSWLDLGFYLGGPVMLKVDDNTALIAGRIVYQQQLKTALFKLNLLTGKIADTLLLPSGGDNSYPGLVSHDGTIYLSYYSAHEGAPSAVYLAQLVD